jgi:hypothetical protein
LIDVSLCEMLIKYKTTHNYITNFFVKSSFKVDSSSKKPLVNCNSVFTMFLNQVKAQRDPKIIIWIEYFPYKYSFKVISND